MDANVSVNTKPTTQTSVSTNTSYYDGGMLGFVGYSILGFLITLCTLGLLYPVAAVMLIDYDTRHTIIDGRRLSFEGTAGNLFVQYLKWWLLCIITIGVYTFWLRKKMMQWRVKHTHLE